MRGVNVNMFYDDLNTEEQVSYLIKPILQVLQEAGGQLERSEIRDRISELDEHIAEFEQKKQAEEEEKLERERRMQEAMLSIKKKFGKNAVLKGMNLEEGATAKDRNEQIGGHKA